MSMHPGRLTWFTNTSPMTRKENDPKHPLPGNYVQPGNDTNLQGCNFPDPVVETTQLVCFVSGAPPSPFARALEGILWPGQTAGQKYGRFRCPAIWLGFIHLFRENPWQYGDNEYTSRIFKMMTLLKKTSLPKKNVVRYEANFCFTISRCFFPWPFFGQWDFWDDLCCFLVLNLKNKSWFLDLNNRGGCSYVHVYPVFLHVYIWCIASKDSQGWKIWFPMVI